MPVCDIITIDTRIYTTRLDVYIKEFKDSVTVAPQLRRVEVSAIIQKTIPPLVIDFLCCKITKFPSNTLKLPIVIILY